MSALPFGPLDAGARHLCVDMQRLFLEPGPWYVAAGLEIIPAIRRLLDHAPERALFTRFITAERAEAAPGSWRRYYRQWHEVTQDELGRAKRRLLGVPAAMLERYGAVSEPVARAMAEGALRVSDADVSVAITGIAGPDGGDMLAPVGTVWFAWARREQPGAEPACLQATQHRFSGSRDEVRNQAVALALEGVLASLNRVNPSRS